MKNKGEPNSITIPSPDGASDLMKREVRAKLAYVDELVAAVSIDLESNFVIKLTEKVEGEGTSRLKKKVESVFSEMFGQGFEPEITVLEDHSKNDFRYTEDPLPFLLEKRHLLAEGPGYFSMGPMLTELADAVENKIKGIAIGLEAKSYRFPALISPAYLEKVKYFSNFPHSLCFVTHLREDLDVIRKFSDRGHTHDGCVVAERDAFSEVQAMLSPTVCHHLYMMLADTMIPEEGLTATAFGNCFRYESSNMVSLERLWNFSMREIIFVGSSDYVDKGLATAGARISNLLSDMGLAYTVETATDPFFIGNYRDYSAYQSAFQLKQEVRAQLPYSGSSIAVGSYNRHRDFFGRTLDIRTSDGEYVNTGCVGFGFERLVFSFIAQYGPDRKSWPRTIENLFQ